MRSIRLFFYIFSLSALLWSCQKEVDLQFQDNNPGGGGNNNPDRSIIGDYDFVGISASTNTTVSVTDAGDNLKAVSKSNYVSTKNSGTIKVTSSDFVFTNVAYSINSTMTVETIVNGISLGTNNMPFIMDSPPTSSNEAYVKNNKDSLTFSNTIFVSASPYAPSVDPAPMGARISWSGDTLNLRIVHTLTGTTDQLGTPGTFTGGFIGVMKLKKK